MNTHGDLWFLRAFDSDITKLACNLRMYNFGENYIIWINLTARINHNEYSYVWKAIQVTASIHVF